MTNFKHIKTNLLANRIRYLAYKVFKIKILKILTFPLYDVLIFFAQRNKFVKVFIDRFISGSRLEEEKILGYVQLKKIILILRPDHIGDFIYSLPSFITLKHHIANDYLINILVDPCNLDMSRKCGLFNYIYVFSVFNKRGKRTLPSKHDYIKLSDEIGEVSILIDARPDGDNFFITGWIKAEKVYRIEKDRALIGLLTDACQNDHLIKEEPYKPNQFKFYSHELDGYRPRLIFNYFSEILVNENLSVNITFEEAKKRSNDCLKNIYPKITQTDCIVFCPEARSSRKMWANSQTRALIDYLAIALSGKFTIILLGKEASTDGVVFENTIDLRGKTNLDEAFTIISSASIFIGFDSGLSHFAGLIGTNVVEIFTAKTQPLVWGAISVQNNVKILSPSQPRLKTILEKITTSKKSIQYLDCIEASDVINFLRNLHLN